MLGQLIELKSCQFYCPDKGIINDRRHGIRIFYAGNIENIHTTVHIMQVRTYNTFIYVYKILGRQQINLSPISWDVSLSTPIQYILYPTNSIYPIYPMNSLWFIIAITQQDFHNMMMKQIIQSSSLNKTKLERELRTL